MTTLRRATPDDAAELARLRGLMHEAMGHVDTPDVRRAAEAAFARRVLRDDFVAYVVAEGAHLRSCGAGWVEEHLPSAATPDGRRGHVASMSTEPAARRQGHARAVFAALLEWFDELGVRRVELRATPDGQPLYAAAGFTVLPGVAMRRDR